MTGLKGSAEAGRSRADLKAELLRRRLAGGGRSVLIPRVSRVGRLPLSFAQQRLWFLDQLQPGGTSYVVPVALRLGGRLDPESLRSAVWALIERHEVLRTHYVVDAGVPSQEIQAEPDLDWQRLRCRGSELAEVLVEHGNRPIDLARGPMVRARLIEAEIDKELDSMSEQELNDLTRKADPG